MSFLSFLPVIGKLIEKGLGIADQAVTDKDKLNELKATLMQIEAQAKETVYLAELNVKTVPWIDGLHKMGRQILNLLSLAAVVLLLLKGITITPEIALILGGPNAIYQFVKGKGDTK